VALAGKGSGMAIDERRRMAHLLRRAGFGATPEELAFYLDLGFEGAVDRLLHPEEVADPELDEQMAALHLEPVTHEAIQTLWLARMSQTKRPLAEKMALFWHGHFATSIQKVKSAVLMWDQYELLRDQGLSSFGDLLLEVSRNPAMLVWLDNWQSKAAAPNENYARELLELFTLGIGTYTEDDVKAAARAFTGWSIQILSSAQIGDEDVAPDSELRASGGSTTPTPSPASKAAMRRTRDAEFLFRPRWHDRKEKTFLGEMGDWDGADIVRIIARHPACATFIAHKLVAFFVWDNPDAATVAPYARRFTETGGDIRAVLEAIFTSSEFSSERAYRARVSSPIELVATTFKRLRIDPAATVGRSGERVMEQLGQVPFAPPNVGGWTDGLGWIGPATILARYNLVIDLLGHGKGKAKKRQPIPLDVDAFLAGATVATIDDLVDVVVDRLLDGDIEPAQRDALLRYLAGAAAGVVERGIPLTPDDPRFEEKLSGLLRLTTTIPTFHLS
jgi:uncharacterized protein (DUF1800 family)